MSPLPSLHPSGKTSSMASTQKTEEKILAATTIPMTVVKTSTSENALISSSNGFKATTQTTQQQRQSTDFITNFFKNLNTMQQQQIQQSINVGMEKKQTKIADGGSAAAANLITTTTINTNAISSTTITTATAMQKPEQINTNNNNIISSSTNTNTNFKSSSSCNANIKNECEQNAVVIKTEVTDNNCQELQHQEQQQQQQQQEQQKPSTTSTSSLVATSLSTSAATTTTTPANVAAKENVTPKCDSNNDKVSSSSSSNNNNKNDDNISDNNLMFAKPLPVLLSAVNPHIICNLCQGYLIDATTIVECLHSFCHSCIMKHLRTEQYCPRCEMMINTAKPNIKPDTTLQAIVYKLVPGLYEKELMKKRAFYKDYPEEAALATPEQRGDDTEHLIFSPSEYMSLSLEYADIEEHLGHSNETEFVELLKPKFLQCPSICTVAHLKKFVYGKFDIDSNLFQVDIMYKVKTIVLLDHYTLMDVAYIYTWKRDAPMRFYFSVKESPRPVIKVRKATKTSVAATTAAANPPSSTVVTKEEVLSDHEAPRLGDDTMAIVHLPTPTIDEAVLPVTQIKEEDVDADIVTPLPPPPEVNKMFEIVPQPSMSSSNGSGQEQSKTDKLKITIVSKALRDKPVNGDLKSPGQTKPAKEKKEQHPASDIKEERRVENIKLKIDLSKQNSVTIINMSDPDRKEIVKPVKPEKEWKVKSKKEKSSPSSDKKRKTPSPLTVPPLTIKADRISPLAKTSPKHHGSPKSTRSSPFQFISEEEQKSQFLKSFALAPIKDVKLTSPEKPNKSPKQSPTKLPKCDLPTSENSVNLMNPPASNILPKISIASKRKSKEPIKAILKKPRFSPPLSTDDFKIKLPPNPNFPSNKPSKALPSMPLLPISSTMSAAAEKSLMPPPAPISFVKPSNPLPKPKQQKPLSKFAPPGSLTPHPMQIIQPAPPGNRTPIAKRYQPILPKAARPNPFANIPTDVNKILKDAGTEIKSISSSDITASPKVYGPKTSNSMSSPTSQVQTTLSNNRSMSQNSSKPHNSNNYLNLALYNATKSKGKEAPPGCRTPMYSPNSPIYSPSSPQYAPNYNIPTIPTYKYTPKPSSGGSSYLQSVLGGNSQMSNLFPAPPTKRANPDSTPTTPAKRSNSPMKSELSKRVYPSAKSPNPIEDPPEKQLKVKSLLTSCNINIPSSLSITITREDSESQSNNTSYPKHKSPVNNYIEILKLPDQPAETPEVNRRPSPPKQNNATSPSGPPAPQPKKENTNTQPHLQLPPQSPMHTSSSLNANKPPQMKNLSLTFNKPSVSLHNINSTNTNSRSTPPNSKSSKTPTTLTNSTVSTTAGASTVKTAMPTPQSSANPLSAAAKNQSKPSEPMGGAVEKKTPSPEKRPLDTTANNQTENKSPKSPTSDSATSAKKFRHILPRQNPTAISEVVPPKVNPGNIIGTYSSPSGVAVKVHANKKVTPPSKKSPTMAPAIQQNGNINNTTNNNNNNSKTSLPKTSPNSSATFAKPTSTTPTTAPLSKSSPNAPNNANKNLKKSNPPLTSSSAATSMNTVSSSSSSNVTNGLNKLVPSVPPQHPALNAMPSLPHHIQALSGGMPNMSAIPNMPAHLAAAANAANQAEISKFLKDNLMRAQAQAAAANQSNMFYSYANAAAQMGQYTPSMYNYQQAYIMEQLSRMQRAGNDAFVEYMQKLKGTAGIADKIPATSMGVGAPYENRNVASTAAKTAATSSKITSPTTTAFGGNQQQTSKIQPHSTKTK